MNLSIKNIDRACLIIIITVSMICGYLTFKHVMKTKERFGIEKDILSKKMNEVNLASINLEELRAALKETKEELNYLNERIPESGKVGLLIKQIDLLMKHRKIALISLQSLPGRDGKIYPKNPIQLMFTGNFVDIYFLINDLEKMNRIMVMNKITITKLDDSNQCRVELMAGVFEPKKAKPKRRQETGFPVDESVSRKIRDIFSPLQLPTESKPLIRVETSPVPIDILDLKGTIIGGEEPMAVINDKFVRMGEKLGEYQIVKIDPNGVVLRSSNKEKILQVMAPADKQ